MSNTQIEALILLGCADQRRQVSCSDCSLLLSHVALCEDVYDTHGNPLLSLCPCRAPLI